MNYYNFNFTFYNDYSDPRIEEYQLEKDYNYTIEEVSDFIKRNRPFYNPKVEELFDFFINFKGGIFYPEKWNNYEPIRNPYTEDSKLTIIEDLSYPSGSVFIKRDKKFWAQFNNHAPGFFWEDKKSMRPKVKNYNMFEILGIAYKKGIKFDDIVEITNEINERFRPFTSQIVDREIFSGPMSECPPEAIVYEPRSHYPEIKQNYEEHLNRFKKLRANKN